MDTTQPKSTENHEDYRAYCHHCDSEKRIKSGVYTCPTCDSEFVEIIDEENGQVADAAVAMDSTRSEAQVMMSNILEETSVVNETRTDSGRQRGNRRNHQRGPMQNHVQRLINHLLQNIIPSVNASNDVSRVLPVRPINLEQWANRLEEFEQTIGGDPPLPLNKIQEIPTSLISQDHLDMNLQCSICWEDFVINETIMKLVCDHMFHKDCIVPWLKLHASCPVCRKYLGDESVWGQNRTGIDPHLLAYSRVHEGAMNIDHGSIVRINMNHSPAVPLNTTQATRTSDIPIIISPSDLEIQEPRVLSVPDFYPSYYRSEVHIRGPMSAPVFYPGRYETQLHANHGTRSEVPPDVEPVVLTSLGTLHDRLIHVHGAIVSRSSSVRSVAPTAIACDTVSDMLPSDHESVMNVDDREPVMNGDDREPVMNGDDREPVMNVDDREPVMNVDDREPVMNVDDREPVMNMDDHDSVMFIDESECFECNCDPPADEYGLIETDDSDEDMDHDDVINV